ncbi:MAG: hypothetical protein ACFFAJ_13290 [Candidatus Hodarchaeota archaeon]
MALNLELALIIDLIVGSVCVLSFFVSFLQQLALFRKYPFQGLRFFTLGFILPTLPILTVTSIIALRIFGLATTYHDILVNFYKFSFSIGVIGIGTFAVGLWNLHPRDPSQKWSSTLIGIGGLVGFSAGAIFTTLDFHWLNTESDPPVYPQDFRYGAIYIDYDFLVIAGIVTLIILLAFIALRYIRDLREIQRMQVKPIKFETKWSPVAYISLLVAFLTLLLQRLPFFENYQLALTFALPLAVAGFSFSTAFRKYPSLLAITSAELSSLTIVNPDGLTLYAYDFKNKETSFDNLTVLLGGMLAALNISLSETLESREGLSSIAFGDKLIVIHSTEKFVIYLITSEMNPTISDLIKIYEKRFEDQFSSIIGESSVVDQDKFLSFSETVEDLIQFAPLSF